MKLKKNFCVKKNCRPRRGIATIYTAFILIGLLGFAALLVDMNYYRARRVQMQSAVDAAALAAAYQLAHKQSKSYAEEIAKYYVSLPSNGGFNPNTDPSVKFNMEFPAKDENGVTQESWVRVKIQKPEPAFFAKVISPNNTYDVGTSAVALFTTNVGIPIKGTGQYGFAPGPVNLSVFGPSARYSYGDCYSTVNLNNGSPNPDYNPGGYDFNLIIPPSLRNRNLSLEIFDPECINQYGLTETRLVGNRLANALNPFRVDEWRTSGGDEGTILDATTTRYTLYYNGSPITSSSKTYKDELSADMQWVDYLTFKPSDYGNGLFQLKVQSINGASENGFDLRLGPVRAAGVAFDSNNGANINADGHIPINFNQSGSVKMNLGKVPIEAAGTQLIVTKFDTDVGAGTIKYTCDSLPGREWFGVLSGDGTTKIDKIDIPETYSVAGNWYAEYTAGLHDTSVWDMAFTGVGPGSPGKTRLIR